MAAKTRSDAFWAAWPEDRLEQVVEWCRAPKTEDSPGGLQHAREQLAADGCKVSLSQLSRFFGWYRVQSSFSGADNFARSVEEALRKQPGLTAEAISEAGQVAFTAMATAAQDPEEFRAMELLRLAKETARTRGKQKDQEIKLAERRVKVMERKLDQLKGALTDEELTVEQKQAKMKRIFGIT
jgi:hypothetical protein